MVRHGKKRIRFGSRDKKKIPDFVDPNKDPRSYIRRYITEQTYKDWFNRNYPDYTIYEAVGLGESDYLEMKKKFVPEQEDASVKEQPKLEPKSEERVTGKWTPDPNQPKDVQPAESQESKDQSIVSSEQEKITKKRTDKLFCLFIVTCIIAKMMRINFSRADRKKLVTTGIGSYIFLYLFAWIMSFTLLNLPQDNISIPFT